jgi:hypothetical protein
VEQNRVTRLGETIYHALRFDPDHDLHNTDNRPVKMTKEALA